MQINIYIIYKISIYSIKKLNKNNIIYKTEILLKACFLLELK